MRFNAECHVSAVISYTCGLMMSSFVPVKQRGLLVSFENFPVNRYFDVFITFFVI